MKNILVTGSSGFLGRSILKELKQLEGYTIFETTEKETEKSERCLFLNLADRNSIDNIFGTTNLDTIIHLAGISSISKCEEEPLNCLDININGAIYLAKQAKKNGVKSFLNFSSTRAANPKNFYSYGKRVVELSIQELSNEKFQTISYRCANVIAAPGSFLLDWKRMVENDETVKSSGKGVTRFFVSKKQVAKDIAHIMKNAETYKNAILIPEVRKAKITSFLTIFAAVYKNAYELKANRNLDNLDDYLLNDSEKEFAKINELEDFKFGMISKRKADKLFNQKELINTFTEAAILETIKKI